MSKGGRRAFESMLIQLRTIDLLIVEIMNDQRRENKKIGQTSDFLVGELLDIFGWGLRTVRFVVNKKSSNIR